MNLSDVYVFKKVAATLSFTKAARQIGASRSAISKQIQRLETEIGVTLVNRTTRTVHLTEAGRDFDRYTSDFDTRVELAIEKIRAADVALRGTVLVALPNCIAMGLMSELTRDFQADYPDIRLHILMADQQASVTDENLDLALTVCETLEDSRLVSRRLHTTRQRIVAAPSYVAEHGAPESIPDLLRHRCLGFATSAKQPNTWRLINEGHPVDIPLTQPLVTDNFPSLIRAAADGHGLLSVPELYVRRELADGTLMPVLDDVIEPIEYGVFALYPHRKLPAKVRVLVDFVESRLASYDAASVPQQRTPSAAPRPA